MAYYTYQLSGLGKVERDVGGGSTGGSSGGFSWDGFNNFISSLGTAVGTVVDAAQGTEETIPPWAQDSTISPGTQPPSPAPSPTPPVDQPRPPAGMFGTTPWYVWAGGGLVGLLILRQVLR